MKHFSFWLLVILSLVAAGCSSVGNQAVTQTNNPPATEIFTITPTYQSPSATPTLTQTPTQPSLTQTPFPTLTSDEVKTKLFNLLLDNGGCNLPCLLGYSPGISTRSDIQNFFRQFRVKDTPDLSISRPVATDRSFIGFYIRLNDNYLNMGISTYEDMGKVKVLEMDGFSQPQWDPYYAEVMKHYMLPQILTDYGQPTEVLVWTLRDDRQRPDIKTAPFFLVLLYSDKGIYIEYEMDRVSMGAEFLGCPSKSFVSVAVWPPGDNEAFSNVVQVMNNGSDLSSHKSVEEATLMSLDEFYQTFKNSTNTKCLRTSIETWPNP